MDVSLDFPPAAEKLDEWRATIRSLVAVANKDDPRPAGPSGRCSTEPPHAGLPHHVKGAWDSSQGSAQGHQRSGVSHRARPEKSATWAPVLASWRSPRRRLAARRRPWRAPRRLRGALLRLWSSRCVARRLAYERRRSPGLDYQGDVDVRGPRQVFFSRLAPYWSAPIQAVLLLGAMLTKNCAMSC